jgi:DNA-binding HxlR family transcriptional regulator
MRSAALNKKNVMPDKATPKRIAYGNVSADLELDGNLRLTKLKARPDLSRDRRNTARAREKKESSSSVTRIESKWAFRILSELEQGPAQLSELCASLRPAPRKTLTEYLRELERAGLIVHIGSGQNHKTQRLEYSLSDPLGIAAVHLINALNQSDGETSE